MLLDGVDDAIRDRGQRAIAGQGLELDFAGALEDEHAQEGIGNAAAHGEQAVVAQDHEIGVAKIGLQAGLFVLAQGHAFVVVVGQAGQREQALLG